MLTTSMLTTQNIPDAASHSGDMPDTDDSSDTLVSTQVRLLFECIGFATICQAIDICGTVANIINIVCFFKMGFKDPVNVSLLGLAISDLGCLLTLMWINVGFNPKFRQAGLPFDPFEFQYLTAGWPHVVFACISSWITALITLERCLCITMPLKVKTIITPKRVSGIITCTFIILIISIVPVYCVNRLADKFYPDRNKTILGLVFVGDRENVEKVSFIVNIICHFIAFVTVAICTITLVTKLQKKTQWRKRAASHSSTSTMANRDQNIAVMVVMISMLFIFCFTPVCVNMLAMLVKPEFSILGKQKNVLIVTFGLSVILESINSSVNIFIYYRMSSKYRSVFRQLFCKQVRREQNQIVTATRNSEFD